MEAPNNSLGPWIAWGAAAALALAAAGLGSLWRIERAETQVLRDQSEFARTTSRALEDQLEAERIVSRRELESLRAAQPLDEVQTALLVPVAPAATELVGAAVWTRGGKELLVRLQPGRASGPPQGYQVWLEAPGQASPLPCGTLEATAGPQRLVLPRPVEDGDRFILSLGRPGGAAGPGPNILASLPVAERIAPR